MKPVIIVGGGWAGLATAIELCRHDVPVHVLDAGHALGGRARTVRINGQEIDNGQHLLLGAYHEFLGLLKVTGASETALFERRPMELLIRSHDHKPVHIALTSSPTPVNLVQGLRTSSGLSITERLQAVRFCMALVMSHFKLEHDMSMKAWLSNHHQPASLVETVWEPLCLAALNTHLNEASARVFLHVIEQVFAHKASDSDLLLSRTALGSAFPEPARRYIEKSGGRVQTRQRVTELTTEQGRITGVITNNQKHYCTHVVIALPPTSCARLLARQEVCTELVRQIGALPQAPICTVYVQYPPQVALDAPFIGLTGGTAQWLFDRRRQGQPGLISVVISGQGAHMEMRKSELCRKVIVELADYFPHWPAPVTTLAIREKKATFICSPEIQVLRPENAVPLSGVWLAGDFTATGYPATLEGAVRSGRSAATGVLRSLGVASHPLPR